MSLISNLIHKAYCYQNGIDEDELDHCYECKGYGDDYYEDENGELVNACEECPYNEVDEDDE